MEDLNLNVSVQADPIRPDALRQALSVRPGVGGLVSFEGIVRDMNEGKTVTSLSYECYEPLAVSEMTKIAREAIERFGLAYVQVVHRVGTLAVGETAVAIQALAAHRAEAFRGCQYVIDELKHRAPIWKKEFYADGSHAWPLCTHSASTEGGSCGKGHRDETSETIPAVVIVSSDRASSGEYVDRAGPSAKSWLSEHGFRVLGVELVPDEPSLLERALGEALSKARLVVVSGGTGIGPRDITPQVVERVADYPVPGIGELLRQESLRYSKNSHLSRCGGYVKDGRLILALPGNPKAVAEQLDILGELLPRALAALEGKCKHR